MDNDQITITPEMYLVIQGQIGNVATKAAGLHRLLTELGLAKVIPPVEDLQTEIDFLAQYLPRDHNQIRSLRDTSAKDIEMAERSDLQGKQELNRVAKDSEEAIALFYAICNAHDMTGEVPETLRGMLEERLSGIETFLRIRVTIADLPF